MIEHTGVADAAEIDIDTLERRIARAVIEHDAIFKPPVLVGGWGRASPRQPSPL